MMELIEGIRGKVRQRRYELSRHAVDQSIVRSISVEEMEEALLAESEVIEDYPEDERGPSCLVLGYTAAGRPLHFQVSYPTRPVLKVITVYEPDTALWVRHRRRKSCEESR